MKRLSSSQGCAVVVALAIASVVGATIPDYGVTWDEVLYLEEATAYAAWLRSPALESIDANWASTHPPLHRILGGLSRTVFHEALGWLEPLTAFRLVTAAFAFVLAAALFGFTEQLFGRAAALATTLMFFAMPRVFFHSHIAALDVPVAAMVLCTTIAYWRSFERPVWIVAAAALLGAGISLKLNAAIALVPMAALLAVRVSTAVRSGGPIAPLLTRQALLLVIPPLLFVAIWPWLWSDPIGRTAALFDYHADHFPIATTYFGRVTTEAPFHYPFVMTALTVPIPTLALAFGGLLGFRRSGDRGVLLFLLAGALAPLVFFALPGIPKSGGVRHFIVGYPFLCLLAGAGIRQILQPIRRVVVRRAVYAGLLACVLLAGPPMIARMHPYQIAYFNAFVGGTRGASALGFDLDYWGSSYRGLLDWMNAHPDRVYWIPLAPRLGEFYRDTGALIDGIRFGTAAGSDTLVLLNRPSFFNDEMLGCLSERAPLFGVGPSGVDLARLCERRR